MPDLNNHELHETIGSLKSEVTNLRRDLTRVETAHTHFRDGINKQIRYGLMFLITMLLSILTGIFERVGSLFNVGFS